MSDEKEPRSGFLGGRAYYSKKKPEGTGDDVNWNQADQDIFTHAQQNHTMWDPNEAAALRLLSMEYLDSADVYYPDGRIKIESDKIQGAIRRWEINTHSEKMWHSVKNKFKDIFDFSD